MQLKDKKFSSSKDLRCRPISNVNNRTHLTHSNHMPNGTLSQCPGPTNNRSIVRPSSMMTSDNTLLNASNDSISIKSIDNLYKQYLYSIDQTLLDDETRKHFQRISLLDSELDKLRRMNIELTKNSERHFRRRISTKNKDPLLKENANLQNELADYIKTLKTTVMSNYPAHLFSRNTCIEKE